MREMTSLLRLPMQRTLAGWVTVAALLACSAGLAYRSLELARILEDVEAERARAETVQRAVARAAVRLAPDQVRYWQALGAEIDFPWNDIFHVIERSTSTRIELLEMAPDKARRTVVLRGEARDVGAVIAYLRSLADQPRVRDAFLTRMQRLERGELDTVEFEIRLSLV